MCPVLSTTKLAMFAYRNAGLSAACIVRLRFNVQCVQFKIIQCVSCSRFALDVITILFLHACMCKLPTLSPMCVVPAHSSVNRHKSALVALLVGHCQQVVLLCQIVGFRVLVASAAFSCRSSLRL